MGQSGAADDIVRVLRLGAVEVEAPGQDLLLRAGLPGNQHRRVRPGDAQAPLAHGGGEALAKGVGLPVLRVEVLGVADLDALVAGEVGEAQAVPLDAEEVVGVVAEAALAAGDHQHPLRHLFVGHGGGPGLDGGDQLAAGGEEGLPVGGEGGEDHVPVLVHGQKPVLPGVEEGLKKGVLLADPGVVGADLNHRVEGLTDAVRPGGQQHGLEALVLRVGHRHHVADNQGVALLLQLAHRLRRGAPGVDDEDVVLGVENVTDDTGGPGDVLVGDQRHLALVVLHQADNAEEVVVGDGHVEHRLLGHLLNLQLGAAPGEDGVEILPLVFPGHRRPGLDVAHLHGEIDVVPLPRHADHGVFQGFIGGDA